MKVLYTVALALLASLQRIEASQEENRDLKVSKNLLDELSKKYTLKADAHPQLQQVISGGYVKIGDKDISIRSEDLELYNVYADGAKVVVDGEEIPAESSIYRSKQDANALVSMDKDGKLRAAVLNDHETGESMTVAPLEGSSDVFVTVTSEDLEETEYEMEEEDAPPEEENRNLRGNSVDLLDVRALESVGDCSSYGYDILEGVFVVESSLCSSVGGSANAEKLVEDVIAATNQYYQVNGLCKKLVIKKTQIYCNSNSDPIKSMLSTASACAGSGGLLDDFRKFVSQNSGLKSDFTQLFYDGSAGPGNFGSNIGCAYKNTLCRTDGYSSGVNNMGGKPLTAQAKLLGHEFAHICSANHITSDTGDIMYPTLCIGWGCSGKNEYFGTTSMGSINGGVNSANGRYQCISKEGSSGYVPPPPAPTCQDDPTLTITFSNGATTPGCAWLKGRGNSISAYCNAYSFFRESCCATCP